MEMVWLFTNCLKITDFWKVVDFYDESSGLFVRKRNGDIVRVAFPKDCLAFQVALYKSTNFNDIPRLESQPKFIQEVYSKLLRTVCRFHLEYNISGLTRIKHIERKEAEWIKYFKEYYGCVYATRFL